jgi:RNA polymerase primary sigma factor
MLNEQYILNLIQPYLNSKRELSEFEFFELFSELTKQEQYEVINIMIKNDIDYVDEKEEETKVLDEVQVLKSQDDGKDFRNLMNLTNEQLCVMYQQGDQYALAALTEKNKRFVYQMAMKISKEYRQQNLTIEDLYMEGNIGLLEAAKKFEASKGYMFTTYSWHWIRQKIVRTAIDTGYMIRIPVHLFEKLIKVNNCRRRHNEATLEELIEFLRVEDELDLTPGALDELIVYSDLYMNTSSLNDVVGEMGDTERIEFVPDENMQVEEIVIGNQLKKDLRKILSTLTEREQKVLDLRFGLTTGREMTLEEVGEVYSLTRERIRQIEAKALKKLRHPSRIKKLEDYI